MGTLIGGGGLRKPSTGAWTTSNGRHKKCFEALAGKVVVLPMTARTSGTVAFQGMQQRITHVPRLTLHRRVLDMCIGGQTDLPQCCALCHRTSSFCRANCVATLAQGLPLVFGQSGASRFTVQSETIFSFRRFTQNHRATSTTGTGSTRDDTRTTFCFLCVDRFPHSK